MNSRLNLLFIWLMVITFAAPADETKHSFPVQFGGSAPLKMTLHTSESRSYTEISWLSSRFDYNNDSALLHLRNAFFALLMPVPEEERVLRIYRKGNILFYAFVDVLSDEIIFKASIPLPENAIVAQLPEAFNLRSGTSATIRLFDAFNYEVMRQFSDIINRSSLSHLIPTTDAQISLPAYSLSNNQNPLVFSFSNVTYTYAFLDGEISILQITDATSAFGFHLLNAGVLVANLCSRHLLRITVIVILVIVIGSLGQTGQEADRE